MKAIKLKLDKSCGENWENMLPNGKGRFCDQCTKTVIDFTHLSTEEILQHIKSSSTICARITEEQLNTPFLDLSIPYKKQYRLPYSKVAAGLLLAASITGTQYVQAQNSEKHKTTQIVVNKSTMAKQVRKALDNTSENKLTSFKGTLFSADSNTPIENAKVTLFTLDKIYYGYSNKKGEYQLEIPENAINDKNVVKVSFDKVANIQGEGYYRYKYELQNLVLNKEEMLTSYNVQAKLEMVQYYLGGVENHTANNVIVLHNEQAMRYETFYKQVIPLYQQGKFTDKEYYHFDSQQAVALYGEEAKEGLIIIVDKD